MKIVGMMSGTSIDGIDVVIVDIKQQTLIEQLFFTTVPWDQTIRQQLFALFQSSTTAAAICQMNFLVAEAFADAAKTAVAVASIGWDTIDVIASHGQTIWHDVADGRVTSTLQIGDPSVLAAHTGVTTVGNFRTADVAVGGQGAPLVSLYDWEIIRSLPWQEDLTALPQSPWRAVQNIGGIGNVTFLPSMDNSTLPLAFDTGPGNVFIDWAATEATGGAQSYDVDGRLAAAGTVDPVLLDEWRALPYFTQAPPKTTGRELFDKKLVEQWSVVAHQKGLSPIDFVAMMTELTAATIADAYRRFAPGPLGEVIVAGGGARNPVLMQRLQAQLNLALDENRDLAAHVSPTIPLRTHADLGIDDKAKEAIAFAFMAYRALHGEAGNLPACTGARRAQPLGQIAPGDNFRSLMSSLYRDALT